MSLSGISLNAVSAPGAGSAISFDHPRSNVSMQVIFTGSPTGVSINLEGTIDGSTYSLLAQMNAVPAAQNGIITAAGPVIGVRANLVSISGGTSPTVTAYVAGS